MDEYKEQLLAEMPDSTLQDVVRNILDEPISEAVKGRLLKPLLPRKYRPSPPPRRKKAAKRRAIAEEFDPILRHKARNILDDPIPEALKGRLLKPLQSRKYRPPPRKIKERKRKAIEKEFDPTPSQKVLRSVKDYQDEIQGLFAENKADELTFRQTPWALGNFLRGWQMEVPNGHPESADPRAFLEEVEPLIQKKLEEELKALKGGLKFQLALKVDLVKVNPDGSEEYTDPVLRHMQVAVLQNS